MGRFPPILCSLYGSTNSPLPLPPTCIPLFISYLPFVNWPVPRSSHIFLHAISYAHKLKGFNDRTKSFLIGKMLTALSREQPSNIRLPITRPIFHQLIRSVTFSNSSAFQRSLFSAMFLVAFYGLFRIGELASKSTRFARSVVQYSNLTFLFRQGQVQGEKITITEYKHNASRRPFDILLAKDVSSPFCPVTALYQYCNIRGNRPGPLFCHADQTPISVHQFNVALQQCSFYCGLDSSRYKTHSFRLGGAFHAAEKGFLRRKFVLLVAGNPTYLKFI